MLKKTNIVKLKSWGHLLGHENLVVAISERYMLRIKDIVEDS